MLGGPTTPIGNIPYFKTVEYQIDYIPQLVALLQSGVATAIHPKDEPTSAYNDALRVKADTSLWASGCKSWYLGKDGKVYIYPWPHRQFQAEMRERCCQSNGNSSPAGRNFPNPSLVLAHDGPPLSQGG
jgi:cyclohexanone monooxygenase